MKYRILMLLPALFALAGGCTSPLERSAEQHLREQLVATHRAYIDAIGPGVTIETSRAPSEVDTELTDEDRRELDRMSGPTAYTGEKINFGEDLEDRADRPTVAMTLRRAIHEAIQSNLTIQIARLEPAVTETQITQAEAVFDAVFFAEGTYSKLDTPLPTAPALGVLGGARQQVLGELTTGIRKSTTTGGQVAIQTTIRPDTTNPSQFAADGEEFDYTSADITLAVTQPLLRNFGADVNRSQIDLSRNAHKESLADLHTRLLDLAVATEAAYWTLVYHSQSVLIQERLLQRGIETRDRIKAREDFDANRAQITEAHSFVESRRAELIRARRNVRAASDELKRLINAKELPVSDETLIQPLETPADVPFTFSLIDSVSTALQHRPEVQRTLFEIKDATIRQRIADNQRLPILNVTGTLRYNGFGSNTSEAYTFIKEEDFIDYILGLQFELPIGNRAAEAAYKQRQIERRASVLNYQRVSQDTVVEVKNALRDLQMDYRLIGAERAARRAAAESLRSLQKQEDAGEALTPEFSDLKLRRLLTLAQNEVNELQALVDYNNAISTYFRSMGTLLERNGIEFNEKQ